ncbi:MAG: sigma-54 interaction domain-containing protein [Gemmatimonadota bacterium]
MAKRLIVVQASDAFARVWDEMAERIGADLLRVSGAMEASGLRAAATILSCAGSEADAVRGVHDAHRAGLVAPLVVGASEDHRLAAQLIRAGAANYFALPGDAARLESELIRIAEKADDRPPPPRDAGFDFSAIVGEHPSLQAAIERATRVIPGGRATVLILGETGTGKELFARAVHDNGPRAREPFVDVNCSAIPATLLESELFGHEKGSFTDARTSKPGLFELADGGTIFLDEISAMPLELQAKLLRSLETREIRRLGGLRARTVDVRIIAAANVDLRVLARDGAFREDLYYRLAVVPIRLPALRERGDDVIRLARYFLARLAETYGLPVPELSQGALAAIARHPWPGNVRELRNAIERGLLLAGDGPIGSAELALDVPEPGARSEEVGADAAGPASPLPFPATLRQLERAAVAATVELYDGNKTLAARELGITRSRLYRILERE